MTEADLENLQKEYGGKMHQQNLMISRLTNLIHQATKAYNDHLRVFEAKLVDLGVPNEELGFEPLTSITSQLPLSLNSY